MTLSAAELAAMRASLAATLFTETATRRRFATAADEYGNAVRSTFTDVAYPARLVQGGRFRQASFELTSDRQTAITEWSLLLPHDADVLAEDQFIVGGVTYEVIGPPVHQPSPGMSTHLRVSLRRTTG